MAIPTIYAVGAVTYALVTGHPPYSAASIGDVLNRDPDLPPPSLRPMLHESVGQLDDIFARTLAYRVTDRWERADTLAERLEAEAYRLEQEAPLRASERTTITDDAIDTTDTTVAADPPVRRRRRRRAWFLLALPVVFVAAGVGGWFLFGM